MAKLLPSVIFLAMHKGGSSFIARDLAAAIDRDIDGLESVNIGNQVDDEERTFEELALRIVGTAAVRVYPPEYDQLVERSPAKNGRLSNIKLVALQRDPRDAAISRFFSVAYSHSPPRKGAEEFLNRRKRLAAMGPDDGVVRMVKPTMREFEHFYRILDSRPDALVTTYETMVTDYRGWLHKVGCHVGWSTAQQEAVFARTKDSLEFPVVGDPTEHVRRITPGNWRRYDRPELRDEFNKRGGDLLKRAGYHWPKSPGAR